MREALSLLIRAVTLLVLLALVLVALVADLTLLPFVLLGWPLFPCTAIAVDAASGGLRRLFGLEDCDQ
jgi:hypothetical protein